MQVLNRNHPLPLRWSRGGVEATRSRRQHVGTLLLEARPLEKFNGALHEADPAQRQLDADQIASAARELLREQNGHRIPFCIYDRLRCAAFLRSMTGDRYWEADPRSAACAEVVLGYLAERDELIPHDAPVVGHLDDAILVEAAWPRLEYEAWCYLDYRRLRRLEAELRGQDATRLGFRRDDWLEARAAEHRLLQRFKKHGLDTYAVRMGEEPLRVH